jgi:hypothetical protein
MWREEKVIDVANRLEFEGSGVQVNMYNTFNIQYILLYKVD